MSVVEDESGWRAELSKRVDAVERVQDALWDMLRDVLGRTSDGQPRIGKIDLTTYILAGGSIIVPLAVVALGYFLTK